MDRTRSNTDLNVTRLATGQIPYLEYHKESSDVVALSNAMVHWWILKDENSLGDKSSQIESAGHIVALYQDELYEMKAVWWSGPEVRIRPIRLVASFTAIDGR